MKYAIIQIVSVRFFNTKIKSKHRRIAKRHQNNLPRKCKGRKTTAEIRQPIKITFYQSWEIILLFLGRGLHRFLLSHRPVYFNLYNKSYIFISSLRYTSLSSTYNTRRFITSFTNLVMLCLQTIFNLNFDILHKIEHQ